MNRLFKFLCQPFGIRPRNSSRQRTAGAGLRAGRPHGLFRAGLRHAGDDHQFPITHLCR